MESGGSATVYGIKYFFRGRRIAVENEPPSDLIDVFLDFVADGLVIPGSGNVAKEQHKHYCDESCAIETCIVLGRPYTNSVKEAFEV